MTEPAGFGHESVRIGGPDGRETSWGIIAEAPVQLLVNDRPLTVLMATPRDLADLARGVLRTEFGIVDSQAVASVAVESALGEYRVHVTLTAGNEIPGTASVQTGLANSACGLCGIESLTDLASRTRAVPRVSPHGIDDDIVLHAFGDMAHRQPLHATTHSAHAAAWCTPDGTLALVREDVGRHNALDKLIGALHAPDADPALARDGFLIMSSRCSYELVHKAAHTSARLLATWSAPTTMALTWSRHLELPLLTVSRTAGGPPRLVHFASDTSTLTFESPMPEFQHGG